MYAQSQTANGKQPSRLSGRSPNATLRCRRVVWLLLCLLLLGLAGRDICVGWADSRSFYLAVYDDRLGNHGDFAFPWVGAAAPTGKKMILQISPDRCYPQKYGKGSPAAAWLAEIPKITNLQTAEAYLKAMKDWNGRPYFNENPTQNAAIYAVCVDEPFWDYNWSPPYGQRDRLQHIQAIRTALEYLAQAVHTLAPKAFFWVNYSQPEVNWMQETSQQPLALNSPSFDVVSLDYYANNFDTIRQKISILLRNKLPSQQLALVASARKDAGASVQALQGMINYAQKQNSQCRLAAGRDKALGPGQHRCPIFLLAAWNAWGWPEAFSRDHPQNAANPCLQPCTAGPDSCVTGVWQKTLARTPE